MWVYWVHLSFLFPLRVLLRPINAYWRLIWPFWEAFISSNIWDHCLNCLLAKFGKWKMAHFQNEKLCFQGQILQQIEIRSWSNGVCHSCCISFRWHSWRIHFISNHFIRKNKVLWPYHGRNLEKRFTVANYLHFPSNKDTFIFTSLFILRIFPHISNFRKASQP